MKIVYINGQELEAATPKKTRKPTEKQLRGERVHRWIFKQRLKDYNRFCRENAERISEFKKHDPDWELPRPTLDEVKLDFPMKRKRKP